MRLKSFLFSIAYRIILAKVKYLSLLCKLIGVKHFFLVSDDVVKSNQKTDVVFDHYIPNLDKFNNHQLFVCLHHFVFILNLVKNEKYDLTAQDVLDKYKAAGLFEEEQDNDSSI
jgi:hypothetical protein